MVSNLHNAVFYPGTSQMTFVLLYPCLSGRSKECQEIFEIIEPSRSIRTYLFLNMSSTMVNCVQARMILHGATWFYIILHRLSNPMGSPLGSAGAGFPKNLGPRTWPQGSSFGFPVAVPGITTGASGPQLARWGCNKHSRESKTLRIYGCNRFGRWRNCLLLQAKRTNGADEKRSLNKTLFQYNFYHASRPNLHCVFLWVCLRNAAMNSQKSESVRKKQVRVKWIVFLLLWPIQPRPTWDSEANCMCHMRLAQLSAPKHIDFQILPRCKVLKKYRNVCCNPWCGLFIEWVVSSHEAEPKPWHLSRVGDLD